MSRPFFAGVLAASLLWAGAWIFLPHQPTGADDPSSLAPCAARCGAGTVCEDDRCVVAAPDPAPDAGARPSKRRSKRRGAPGAAADLPTDQPAEALPPLVDDRAIPPYSEAAAKTLDMNAGSERLSEQLLDAQLRRLTPAFQACIRDAIARDPELGGGTITIKATIAGSGRVEGVSASAPPALRAPGVIPCVRKAVHDHRFPTFDGPSMNATFRFEVD